MDRYKICRRWLTPTIVISGITADSSHLYFSGIFNFIFPILSFPPTQRNNIYHRLYYMIFEIHDHQPLNKCLLLFGCLDNTIITQSIRSFRIISTFITVSNFWSFLLVFFIIISIYFGFRFFNKIISTSMWHIIFFR